ncbi:hypothetical protein STANM337S_04046 [Streptomyces tanashiensis]
MYHERGTGAAPSTDAVVSILAATRSGVVPAPGHVEKGLANPSVAVTGPVTPAGRVARRRTVPAPSSPAHTFVRPPTWTTAPGSTVASARFTAGAAAAAAPPSATGAMPATSAVARTRPARIRATNSPMFSAH